VRDHLDDYDGVRLRTWHPRPSHSPLVEYGAERAETCELCRSSKTATLIPVDPASFSAQLPASVTRIVPSVSDSRDNRRLWELSDATAGAIDMDAPPLEARFRPRGSMAFVFHLKRLLTNPEFRAAAIDRLKQLMRDRRKDPISTDLLLIPEHELELAGAADLINEMTPLIGVPGRVLGFPPRGDWAADLVDAVREAERAITVLNIGSVSGTTLQSAVTSIQSARRPGHYELTGLVLHARPPDIRAWRTLENSYSHRLFYAWHTYLPDWSPLEDEKLTLAGLHPDDLEALSETGRKFVADRRRFPSQGVGASDMGPLWGTNVDTKVSPDSIFGQGIRGVAIYAAVAAAMQRSRYEARDLAAPARRVFEMPAIARSYYDPLILGSVLRWAQPDEIWWGAELGEEAVTVAAMLERATPAHRPPLLAELLLAAAQGKLNAPGARVARTYVDGVLAREDLSETERSALEVGARLVAPQESEDARRLRVLSTGEAITNASTPEDLLNLVPGILRDLRQGRLPIDVSAQLSERVFAVQGRVQPGTSAVQASRQAYSLCSQAAQAAVRATLAAAAGDQASFESALDDAQVRLRAARTEIAAAGDLASSM
jgi:hypothetical protein